MVEDIAVTQWKLARIDRNEARIHDPAVPSGEYALALHRIYLTQTRLQKAISSTIADLERYRKERIQRQLDVEPKGDKVYQMGLIWYTPGGERHYTVLPTVLGLDGVRREIPREVLGDFPTPPPTDPRPPS